MAVWGLVLYVAIGLGNVQIRIGNIISKNFHKTFVLHIFGATLNHEQNIQKNLFDKQFDTALQAIPFSYPLHFNKNHLFDPDFKKKSLEMRR